MTMTVSELIAELEQMPADAPVKLAHQPQWPFEYSIADVILHKAPEAMTYEAFEALDDEAKERLGEREERGEVAFIREGADPPVDTVFIGEGTQLGYLTEGVSAQLGWR